MVNQKKTFFMDDTTSHIFALWLQAQVSLFRNGSSCMCAAMARYYKEKFDLLDTDSYSQDCMLEAVYGVFVQDLCKALSE